MRLTQFDPKTYTFHNQIAGIGEQMKPKTAILNGHKGPYLLEQIKQLNVAQETASLKSLGDLQIPAKEVEGFKPALLIETIETCDGYKWFASLSFERSGGEVVILFPWKQREEFGDILRETRNIAIYTKGTATEDDAAKVLFELIVAIENVSKPILA